MPFRPEHSLLNLNLDKMHTIDTRSVENLFGLWTVFSKTSAALEDGKRLENLSWRLWNRETFCCRPETQARSRRLQYSPRPEVDTSLAKTPELASSINSASTIDSPPDVRAMPSTTPSDVVRPELTCFTTEDTRSRGKEKHITPSDLEKIVTCITEQHPLGPLPELPTLSITDDCDASNTPTSARVDPCRMSLPPSPPASLARATSNPEQTLGQRRMHATAPIIVKQAPDISPTRSRPIADSSASTVLTEQSQGSSQSEQSQRSPDTSLSTHNVVRGFLPGGAPSSYRSQTQLAPEPLSVPAVSPAAAAIRRGKKGAFFTLGTSSEDEAGSMGSQRQVALSPPQKNTSQGCNLKHASFADDNVVTKVHSSPVFESEDDAPSSDGSGGTEDDHDASEWEDEAVQEEDSASKRPAMPETRLFQRVDSRPELTSHRSLLTSLVHEVDRKEALAQAMSRSTPAAPRTKTSSPAEATTALSRQAAKPPTQSSGLSSGLTQPQGISIPKTPSNQMSLSPRSTRRNMLSTELTESLRKNLLWERQQKMTATSSNIKRRHTAMDMNKLCQQADIPQMSRSQHEGNQFSATASEYLHAGFEEYHAKGW